MGKVRRKRKYSHWKYENSQPTSNSQTKAHQFYLDVAYPLNTSSHFVTFPLLFYTSLSFTITLHSSILVLERNMLLKGVGIQSSTLNFS